MKQYLKIFGILSVAAGLISPSAAGAAPNTGPELESALAELRLSDAEWRRERDLYHSRRASGSIQGREADEYAEFVASLQRQKFENCENVRRIGGDEALAGTDCLVMERTRNAGAPPEPAAQPAATEAEKVESLEQELKRLEAELDEELAKSQQASREKANTRAASRPSSGAGEGPKDGSGGAALAPASKWSNPDAEKPAGDRKRENAEKPGGTGGSETGTEIAKQTPDGNHDAGAASGGEQKSASAPVAKGAAEGGDDDDVVLRQIREAAENEQDPVLREKLWAEYRKMKAARQ